MKHVGLTVVVLFAVVATGVVGQGPAQTAENVIVITIDGLRWQEMFGGADSSYFKKGSNGEPTDIEKRYVRSSPEDGRSALLPFLWGELAKRGQIFGDPSLQSRAHMTNGVWVSYPGYNEMFAGAADPRIASNARIANPNITVFEWLNTRPGFSGKVAAFGAWIMLPFILNVDRSHIPVGSGFTPVPSPRTDRQRAINQAAEDLPLYWSNYGTFDGPFVDAAIESLRIDKPRVLYVMLGEGDNWAHEGRYDLYIEAANRADRFIRRIWETAQALPEYARKTTLLVTTDHGRGATSQDWMNHGAKLPAADSTWIAALGAGVAPLGLREGLTVTSSQLAATIAAVVGEDYTTMSPGAARPLPDIGGPGK
jgi:Metalloenzyme superfamily